MVVIDYTVLDTETMDDCQLTSGQGFMRLKTGYVTGCAQAITFSTLLSVCKKRITTSTAQLRDPAVTGKAPSIVLCAVGLQ